MKPKIREILDDCIADGLRSGYRRAHKYDDEPCEETMISYMEDHIWLEIDRRFDFERNVCSEVIEGLDHLPKHLRPKVLHPLEQEEEVNRLRAKKKQIYEDLKDAVDREWVGLTDDEINKSVKFPYHFIPFARAIEAKLKEKNS